MTALTIDPRLVSDPARTLRVVRAEELEVRRLLDADDLATHQDDLGAARELVAQSLVALEMTLIVTSANELASELGLTSHDDEAWASYRFWDEMDRRTRMDARLRAIEYASKVDSAPEAPRRGPELLPMDTFVRQAASVVAACPIERIELAARHADMPEEGHRCRIAYDVLRAIVVRRTHSVQVNEVGQAYRAGQLTLTRCARILGVSNPDAIALLEDAGFGQSLEVVHLSEGEELSMLEALRVARVSGAAPSPSAHRASRRAVASMRIEDVDARRWLTLKNR